MKITNLTLKQTINGLKKKDFSSKELVKEYLNEIDKLNTKLNVYNTVFAEKALKKAEEKDKIINSKENSFEKKPLLGIPLAIKDNYLTKNQRTTASSKVLDQYKPQYSSTVIKKLKKSGAIILGKTNMDAWAHGSSTETSYYGPTKNPHDPTRIPGGSSGGSAAAVAANLAPAAFGTETAGSIRQPSSWCGITGFKPTYGRVSRYGIIAMGSSLDSPGPMTKTAYDAAYLTSIIAGKDPKDATTTDKPVPKYHEKLAKDIKGLKIGIPSEYFLSDAQPGINSLVMQEAKKLEEKGAILKEVSTINPHYAIYVYTIIQRSEVFSNLSRYDGIRYGSDRTSFGKEAKRRIILGAYALKIGQDGKYYRLAQKVRRLIQEDFAKIFKKVDVLLTPTLPSIAPKLGASKDQAMFGELSDILQEPSALAGLTSITVPCGKKQNMPIGMQFIANHYQEQKILDVANYYQLNFDWTKNVI